MNSDLVAVCAHFLGHSWAAATPETIRVTIITGGITNSLYRVEYEAGSPSAVLVRVFGEKTEILIDRTTDNFAFKFMGEQGIGPKCFGVFENGRVEEWLPARPLTPPEMGQRHPTDYVAKIATEVARFHLLDYPTDDKSPILWKVRGRRSAGVMHTCVGCQGSSSAVVVHAHMQ